MKIIRGDSEITLTVNDLISLVKGELTDFATDLKNAVKKELAEKEEEWTVAQAARTLNMTSAGIRHWAKLFPEIVVPKPGRHIFIYKTKLLNLGTSIRPANAGRADYKKAKKTTQDG